MAVTTVSSLTESFISNVPSSNDEGIALEKPTDGDVVVKTVKPHIRASSTEEATVTEPPANATPVVSGTEKAAGDESDESDFDGELEVHD